MPRGGAEVYLYSFFNLATRGGRVFNDTLRALCPQERRGTDCTGGWVGPRVDLDTCGKSRHQPEFDPRPVQPVASRYAIPAKETNKNTAHILT